MRIGHPELAAALYGAAPGEPDTDTEAAALAHRVHTETLCASPRADAAFAPAPWKDTTVSAGVLGGEGVLPPAGGVSTGGGEATTTGGGGVAGGGCSTSASTDGSGTTAVEQPAMRTRASKAADIKYFTSGPPGRP